MKTYVNIGIFPETREKLRLLASCTNAKKAQIVDDALTEYSKKIFSQATKDGRKPVEKPSR